MIKSLTLLFSLGLLLLSSPVLAQFKLGLEVRPRSEYRNGFKTLNAEQRSAAFFTEQRTRIYAGYSGDDIDIVVSLQDVRIWGATDQIYKSDPSLTNIHMAYARYHMSPKWAIAAGRMELNYDNARIFGNLAWAQQSRSHDLAQLTFSDSTFQVHVGAAFNQSADTPEFKKVNGTYYNGNNYKTMQYAWLHKDFSKLSASLLLINAGVQNGPDSAASVSFKQTSGGILNYKISKSLKLTAEGYYQSGSLSEEQYINAYMLAGSIGYKVSSGLKVDVGIDYLSGTDSQAGGKTVQAFSPDYGTNHKFYGFMDYFYVGNPHGNVGLKDYYIKGTYKPAKKITTLAHVHFFNAAAPIYTGEGSVTASSSLGTEFDLVLVYAFNKAFNIKAGYSQLFATESMEYLKKGDASSTNNWAWMMLTFKPKLTKL
ncbi:alginate export family protein [Persicobacter psychrovividus]|uniref:Alginate export domain-containing protein n=1 Tax=Persicobacter psychrovividus TaxID=387638 RepID=A0ABM7VI74_9BACT|nr:hypothetical protein PEPS_29500 [Persicobacter psychrovividus]